MKKLFETIVFHFYFIFFFCLWKKIELQFYKIKFVLFSNIKFSKNLKFVFLVKCFSFVYSKKKIIFFNKVPQKKNPNINLK